MVVLTDFYKDNFSAKWLSSKWNKVKETVLALPFSKNKTEVMRNDARSLDINTDTCTFVLTSPPYINIFNYHQQYRASVEFLNGSVLPAAQAEIGSNRKNRGNRYLTVVQYCEDMVNVFSEINRVCKKDSHIIFVVGRESAVMKTPFYNGKIIVPCSKYLLLYDWLDMTPISTSTTAIDEIIILRKAKRISSSDRQHFAVYEKRKHYFDSYKDFLLKHPYHLSAFERFIEHIEEIIIENSESEILERGYF